MAGQKPKFVACFNYSDNNVRAYLHNFGLGVFGDLKDLKWPIEAAETHLMNTLGKLIAKGDTKKYSYMLAFLWGNAGAKMIDWFGYSGIEEWPGNPEVSAWVTREGIMVPRKNLEIACGDGLIVLGEEERYRRRTRSLKEYLERSPKGLIKGE